MPTDPTHFHVADIDLLGPYPPPLVPLACGIAIPPPGRGTLNPVLAAPACSATALALQSCTSAADTDEEVTVVTELNNPQLASELSIFIADLQAPGRDVGIAAFLLFSFVFKLRVAVWFGVTRHDIVGEYAPWANEWVTEWATVEAVI